MAKGPTEDIRMRVSRTLFEYLTLLKENTVLGASENDVASYLLTKQIESMQDSKYLEQHLLLSQSDIDKLRSDPNSPKP
jgi:hypothetical protein